MTNLCAFLYVSWGQKCHWNPSHRMCKGSVWRHCGISYDGSEAVEARNSLCRGDMRSGWASHSAGTEERPTQLVLQSIKLLRATSQQSKCRKHMINCFWTVTIKNTVLSFKHSLHRLLAFPREQSPAVEAGR